MTTPASWPEEAKRLRRILEWIEPNTDKCPCDNCRNGIVFETGEDHYLALIVEPWNHPYETFDASFECRFCGIVGATGHTRP